MNTPKLTIAALASLALAACSSQTQEAPRTVNHDWLFLRADSLFTPDDSVNVVSGLTLEGRHESVDLPHTPRFEPMVVNDQWQGICYYTKHLALTNDDLEHSLYLKFEGAQNVAQVFVNGRLATEHMGGYLPFLVKLNDFAAEGDNVIVVRLDNRDNKTTGPKPLRLLDFNTYGGLYRSVSLVVKNDLCLTDPNDGHPESGIRTSTTFDGSNALLHVVANIESASPETSGSVRFELKDAEGNTVASASTDIVCNQRTNAEADLLVANAHRWSPADPALYSLEVAVYKGSTLTDEQAVNIGFRQIEVRPEGLYLNGQKTFLRGVNRHQEYPFVGYALSDAAQWRDAWKIKQGGFDYVRASHYPPSPAFLDACDHLGIMVLDAILGWQYFGDKEFEKHAINSSRELIRRDRNHPCILAWELSINETQMPHTFIDSTSVIRDQEQPSSLTAGWMKGAYDIYIEARQHRHGLDTLRPLIVSEYGDWEYYAQNAGFNQDGWGDLLQEERTSRQPRESSEQRLLQQALNVQEAHNDNRSTHAFADGYWVLCDYNRGYADDLEYSGAMDIFRQPKYAYEFFRSQRPLTDQKWAEPMVFIASECTEESARDVRVYSNCPQVRFLAGEAEVEPTDALASISQHLESKPLVFNVGESMPDSLTAIGLDAEGNELCRHTVRRPLTPSALTLRVDLANVPQQYGVNDPIFVHADLVDERGTTVRSASDNVTMRIEQGDALFATPNGPSRQFTAPTLGGTASAVLIVGRQQSPIVIAARANESKIKSEELTIK